MGKKFKLLSMSVKCALNRFVSAKISITVGIDWETVAEFAGEFMVVSKVGWHGGAELADGASGGGVVVWADGAGGGGVVVWANDAGGGGVVTLAVGGEGFGRRLRDGPCVGVMAGMVLLLTICGCWMLVSAVRSQGSYCWSSLFMVPSLPVHRVQSFSS